VNNKVKVNIAISVFAVMAFSFIPWCASQQQLSKSKIKPQTTDIKSKESKSYNSRAIQHFMDGETYSLQGDYAMAVIEYLDALQYDTTSSTIYVSLGKAYINLGKIDNGIRALENAIRLDSTDYEAREILAQVYFLSGKTEKAEREYEVLNRAKPDDPEIQYQLAIIYLKINKIPKALEIYESIFKKDSTQSEALEKAAEISIISKDLEKAIYYYDLLIKQNPENLRYLKSRSELSIVKNDFDTIDIYKKLIIKVPNDLEIREILGEILSRSNRYEEAKDFLELFIKEYPDRKASYINLSLLLMRNDKYEGVVNLLDSVISKFPEDPILLLIKGTALNYLERYDEAEVSLIETLKLDPQNTQGRHILAAVWDTCKKYNLSDSLYERIIMDSPDDDIALNNYSYSLAVRGENLGKALEMVNKALEKNPENASYLDTKGWILYKQDKFEDALIYVEKSLSIEKNNAEIMEHLGDIYYRLKKHDKANEYYKRAYSIDSKNENLKKKISE